MSLPEVNEDFFREHARGASGLVWAKWQKWLNENGGRKEKAKYIQCLALCENVDPRVVYHWMSKNAQGHAHVSSKHWPAFARISTALNWPVPAHRKAILKRAPKRDSMTRVTVFASFEMVSESYFIQVLRGLVRGAAKENVILTCHELPTHAGSAERAARVEAVVSKFDIDAVVLLRITPDKRFLCGLESLDRNVPLILIHAQRQQYPKPVLANFIPEHRSLRDCLEMWVRSRPHIDARGSSKVVLVTMPKEREQGDFAKVPGAAFSVRNERIRLAWKALEGFHRQHETVSDYAFQRAWQVWEKHSDAAVFVCFSDQVAVALKQLLRARRPKVDWWNRVIGYDGSPLACQEDIASISQDLDQIGVRVMARLRDFLIENASSSGDPWSLADGQEVTVPVRMLREKGA